MGSCISQTRCRDKSPSRAILSVQLHAMEGNEARGRCLHAAEGDLPPHWMPTIPYEASDENLVGPRASE